MGREAVVADLTAVFGPALEAGATMTAASVDREIGVAPDGRGAWVAEGLTVTISGEPATVIPYRVTSVLSEDGGAWTVIAQAWSVGVTNEEAMAMATAGQLPPLAAIEPSVGEGAQAMADQLQAGCADASVWLASWSERPDAFAFGSAPEEAIEGGTTIREGMGQMVAAYQMTIAVNGGMHAKLAPSGTVGFLAANLDMGMTLEGVGTVSQPYRALFVYLQEEGGWRLVQSHFSNGLPQ